MATLEEQAVLNQYSTPGLRKGELSRQVKADHLASQGIKGEVATKILDQLYPTGIRIFEGEDITITLDAGSSTIKA